MKCNAKFFGLKILPTIYIDSEKLEELAQNSINMGLTVPGIQKKLSLHLSDEKFPRLTLRGYPPGYILKPQSEGFKQLPEAEDLVMDIADLMGVKTVPHGLISIDGTFAYITKRIDRSDEKMYAMEDFCQLSERLTYDKYKGSYERCADIIRRHSSMPGFDLSELFLRLLVCFITGNSDMHLKNFSLIEQSSGGRDFVLSQAYDLLPVNVVMPEDPEETALTLNGKKAKLKCSDFLKFADSIGLNTKSAHNMILGIISKAPEAIALCRKSTLNEDLKKSLIDIINNRCERLTP